MASLLARPFAKSRCTFTKVDAEHGIAYGWAIVSTVDGEPYYDLQGDHVPVDAVVKAATNYMAKSRASDDQHDEVGNGFVPFCMPVYKGMTDNLLGLDASAITQEGLIIGSKLDAATLEKIAAGERRGFSIGGKLLDATYKSKAGKAIRVPVGQHPEQLDAAFVKHVNDAIARKSEPTQRRVFVDFEIDFISTVDWPAQEGALIRVVKGARAVAGESFLYLSKMSYLTSEEAGHQHVVTFGDHHLSDDGSRGWTSYATSAGDEVKAGTSHSHDFVIDIETGEVTIAANEGHTHTLAEKAPQKSGEPSLSPGTVDLTEIAMRAPGAPDPILDAVAKSIRDRAGQKPERELASLFKEQLTTMDKDLIIAELRKSLASVQVLAEMSDAHRAHRGRLGKRDADAFDAMTGAQRDAETAKAVESDGVVYTCDDGTKILKSHGQIAERMARRNDDLASRVAKAEARSSNLEFEKRAKDQLGHYPGPIAVRAALVKAIDSIPDDATGDDKAATRKAALAAIAAGDKALSKSFRRVGKNAAAGTDNTVGDDNPIAKLDELAKAHAKEHKISFHKAYEAVLKTEEGTELYASSQDTHGTEISAAVDDYDDDDGDYEDAVDDDGGPGEVKETEG